MNEVLALLRRRFSPRAFASRDVDDATLGILFEAARWAPSCRNEQPWSFVVMRRGTGAHDQLLGCLSPGNQVWAATAPLLVVAVAREIFAHDDSTNRHAWYDLGQAMANLLVAATACGLHAHQMAGFDTNRAAGICALPAAHAAVTVTALGYRGDATDLPAGVSDRDPAARERKARAAFVFEAQWGVPWCHAERRDDQA